jgi:cytochrome c oxidase assembly protein subunit 11
VKHFSAPSTNRNNVSLLISLVGVVIGMLMLSYASVPLYSMFCRITGYGGTPRVGTDVSNVVLSRHINVTFNTDIAPDLLWSFKSLQSAINTPIGERQLAFFEAKNLSDRPIKATATFNVTPFKTGEHFVKIQCFCFEEQTINAGESATFPVSFYIDPAIAKDKNLDDVRDITLSYTFFPVPD